MPVIGDAPGSAFKRRRMRPGPINEMDKTTIVSIYNKEISERKSTIFPGHVIIPPGTMERPSLVVLGQSRWWKEVDAEQDLFEVPVSSTQFAASVVNDYCSSLVGVSDGAKPGVFYLTGDIVLNVLLNKHTAALRKAENQQNNWYRNLVAMTDTDWARTNGNPLAVSADARAAAKALNLTGKDWMQDFVMMENVRCIACGQPRNPKFPICPSCHRIVDKALFDRLGIQDQEAGVLEPPSTDPNLGPFGATKK